MSEATTVMPPRPKGRHRPPTATVEELAEIKRYDMVDKYAASKILGMHPDSMTRSARSGRLNVRCSNVSGRWMFSVKDLCALAEGRL